MSLKYNKVEFLRIVLIFFAVLAWIIMFYPFLSGQKQIIDDAHPYYEHVKYYLDNLTKGIYPLWDPIRDFGVDNEFYLRRIGEFNPAYLLIVLLQKCGISFLIAHRIFLMAYFFLGAAGFYFLAKRVYKNNLTPFFILILVVFSSLGSLSFQSYLLLLLVPQIWFLYFLVSFLKRPMKSYLLGLVFSLMIVSITYIPFYFLTVMLCGAISFVLVYQDISFGLLRCGDFVLKNKKFVAMSLILTGIGLTPGIMWYQQSSHGEMAVVYRHSGASTASTASLHINVVNEGGILAPQIVEKIFFELNQARVGDFYFPVFMFLVLLMAVFLKINRRFILFFIWGLLVYLIGIADAGRAHQFLYQHVPFFKYFRNLQFFLWLGVLPAVILFVGQAFDGLMEVDHKNRRFKYMYLAYVVLLHLVATAFFLQQKILVVIVPTYMALFFSCVFFIIVPYKNRSWMALPVVLFLAIAVQAIPVFGHMIRNMPAIFAQSAYDGPYAQFSLPKIGSIENLLNDQDPKRFLNQPYYSTKQFEDMYQNMSRPAVNLYIKPRLLLYDHVRPFDSNNPNWTVLTDAFSNHENVAFVPPDQMGSIPMDKAVGSKAMTVINQTSSEVAVLEFSSNRLVLKTNLKVPRFLVYNNVYHSKWKMYCDGEINRIFRANHAFMGVLVPAGVHTLEFVFQSQWRILLGYGLEIIFVLTLGGVLFCLYRKQI